MKILIRGGTQRSWDREVGYGPAPNWYLNDRYIEMPEDPANIDDIAKAYGDRFIVSDHDR